MKIKLFQNWIDQTKIFVKAYYLNKNKEEHKALLGRIKYQFMINIHSRNYPYIFKYIFFYIKVFFKSL